MGLRSQSGGTRAKFDVTCPQSKCAGPDRGVHYFRNLIIMDLNRSLHLCIDGRVRFIPISMKPVQLGRCEDRIFILLANTKSGHYTTTSTLEPVG